VLFEVKLLTVFLLNIISFSVQLIFISTKITFVCFEKLFTKCYNKFNNSIMIVLPKEVGILIISSQCLICFQID